MLNTATILIILMYVILIYLNYNVCNNRLEIIKKPLRVVVTLTIVVGLLPFGIIAIAFFWITRQVVKLLLTIWHGSRFGGLLEGADATFSLRTTQHFTVDALFIIQYDDHKHAADFYTYMRKALREIFAEELGGDVKILSVVKKFVGYSYYIRNGVTFEDCCRQLNRLDRCEDVISREDIKEIISGHSSEPLPKNRAGLWEVLIGTQRIKWVQDNAPESKDCYPIVLRFNHALMDGESFINLIVGAFSDQKIKNKNKNEYKSNTPLITQLKTSIKDLIIFFGILCIFPGSLVAYFYKSVESKTINNPQLRGKKLVSFKAEESPRYVKIIKEIKNKVEGCTFTDVILTAFSASLYEHLEKTPSKSPHFTPVAVTSIPNILVRRKLQMSSAELDFANKFTMYFPLLPLKMKYESGSKNPLIRRLQFVKHQMQLVYSSYDGEVICWVATLFGGIFPTWITEICIDLYTSQGYFTNLPGMPAVTVFGGCPLLDFIPFLPHKGRSGMGFVFLTYASRMQIGFAVDEAIISDQEKVDQIVNGVCAHLDLLHKEVSTKEEMVSHL